MSMLLSPMPLGGYPLQPAVPQAREQVRPRFQPDFGSLLSAVGATIATGDGSAGQAILSQMGEARRRQAMVSQQNQATVKWLHAKGRSDLAEMVESGALPAMDAFKAASDQQRVAPSTDMGKLKADFDAGYLSREQYESATRGGGVGIGIDPKEAFKREQDLRQEYNKTDVLEAYGKIRDAYERIRATAQTDSGPGDLGLVFNYMKMLDPGSIVRRDEFATAENAGGVTARIRNVYNNLLTGERLEPGLRQQFVKAADDLYSEAARNLEDANTRYGPIADQWGVPRARVLIAPEKYEPLKLGESVRVAPGVTIRKVGD